MPNQGRPRTLQPRHAKLYPRPHRYLPTSTATNISDFLDFIEFPDLAVGDYDKEGLDLLLCVSDNAMDYSVDSPLWQHMIGRVWRAKAEAPMLAHPCN